MPNAPKSPWLSSSRIAVETSCYKDRRWTRAAMRAARIHNATESFTAQSCREDLLAAGKSERTAPGTPNEIGEETREDQGPTSTPAARKEDQRPISIPAGCKEPQSNGSMDEDPSATRSPHLTGRNTIYGGLLTSVQQQRAWPHCAPGNHTQEWGTCCSMGYPLTYLDPEITAMRSPSEGNPLGGPYALGRRHGSTSPPTPPPCC